MEDGLSTHATPLVEMPHTDENALDALIKTSDVEVGGTYYHYRNPHDHYQVVMIAISE